jgi:hypothetical protein
VLSLMFQLANDRERADLADIDVLWRPAERYSLTERTMAATQALAAGVPWATRMTTIMQYSPQDLVRMEIERADDAVLAPATAAVQTIGQQNAAAGAQPAQNAAGAATPAANAPTAQNAAQSGTRPA